MIFAPSGSMTSGTMTGTRREHRVDWFAGMRVFVCAVALGRRCRAVAAPGPTWAICGVYPPKKAVSPKAGVFLALLKMRSG
jgi:hypothetical protein